MKPMNCSLTYPYCDHEERITRYHYRVDDDDQQDGG